MLQSRTLNKIDVALSQLDAAIAADEQGQDLVAITLAGAAEEILGGMCRRKNIQNAVEQIANLAPMLQISDKLEHRIAYLNNVRNNLKHACDPNEDSFTISDLDSFLMIARALGNAELLGLALTERMMTFGKKP